MNDLENVKAVDLDEESIAYWRAIHKAAIHTKSPRIDIYPLRQNAYMYDLSAPDQRHIICKKCWNIKNWRPK